MKQLAVVVLLVACGGKQPAPTTSNTSTTAGTAAAPTIPAEWASLGDGTVEADLDGDGKPEAITVAGDEYAMTLSIDGAPYTCDTESKSEFDHIQIVDLEPTLPGLEIIASGHLSDADHAYCYVAKVGGKLEVLAVYNSFIEGNLIEVMGTCSDEPMVYKRVASGFEAAPELVPEGLETNCCDGPDCP